MLLEKAQEDHLWFQRRNSFYTCTIQSSQINTLILNAIPLIGRQVLSVIEKEEVPVRPVFWVIFTSGTQRIRKVRCLYVYEQNCSTLFSGSDRKCSFQQDLGCQLSSTIGFRNPKEERKAMADSQGQISNGHPNSCGIREFGRKGMRHRVKRVALP